MSDRDRSGFLLNSRAVLMPVAGMVVVVLVVFLLLPTVWGGHAEVDFNEDIRPIFNEKCITCHGGVRQNGGFSVLFRSEALDTTESGKRAIVPGHPGESNLIRLVKLDDPDERMPQESKPLTEAQIETLEAWIEQGARWEKHWAYIPPEAAPLTAVSDTSWPRNGIDYFVLATLEAEGLSPSPQADCATLMRRVSLDLIGLPPTPERVEAFCSSPAPDRFYARAVDSLLASPRFGERWASMWLDLARYATSMGFEKDPRRTIWKYRDWVIRAFNRDLPFDQFTIEQLAGDLLPDPGKQELIATAFHRNTMTNTEGGTNNEEFRVASVIDRVNTTMEVWQGTTIKCVQCHSHPYDPFRHEEYYQLFAFFNQTKDADRRRDRPTLATFSEEHREEGRALMAEIGRLRGKIDSLVDTPAMVRQRRRWEDDIRGSLSSATDDDVLDRESFPVSTDELVRILRVIIMEEEERALSQQDHVEELFGKMVPELEPLREKLTARREAVNALDPVRTPVMQALPPGHRRTTYVHVRGNWLVHGKAVEPGVPASLNPWPDGAPKDRLGLAKWLVSEENPLTARVMVNRFWAQLFGKGIVRSLGDFGTQGARPTHPKLLDWLAVRFMKTYDWSIKALLKQIVMSATYRQSSAVSPALLARDPDNKLLARGPRFRLTAEQVRDQALFVSGLLSDKMFGPSVMPPQPEGLWNNPYSALQWETSEGDDRYRRAVYIFWRRTMPYPSMITFDAPSREKTVSRRVRTNTPLQALVTLNDPVYVEAARALAGRMIEEGGEQAEDQILRGYRLALLHDPAPAALDELVGLYEYALGYYRDHPEKARALTRVGRARPEGPEKAALTLVASALMNLDAFITKE